MIQIMHIFTISGKCKKSVSEKILEKWFSCTQTNFIEKFETRHKKDFKGTTLSNRVCILYCFKLIATQGY